MVRKKKIGLLQTRIQLIINGLSSFSFASSFAKSSTLMQYGKDFRLRIQSILSAFANENPLIYNGFSFFRLRNRLQIYQLSPLTSLQAQVVSFEVGKERIAANQSIHPNFFAGLFANFPNLK